MHRLCILLTLALFSGCDDASSDDPPRSDAEPIADAMPDSGDPQVDMGTPDATSPDAGPPETDTWRRPENRTACDDGYGRPEETGTLSSGLKEISGLATSALGPDRLWAHNDSGDEARLYGLDTEGRVVEQVTLLRKDGSSVTAVDFEDLAAAPCPDGNGACLWVADIGDNPMNRDGEDRLEPRLYIAREPPPGIDTLEVDWHITLDYPRAPMDSEALVVAPDGQRFAIIEKIDDAEAEVLLSEGVLPTEGTLSMVSVGRLRSPGVQVERGRMITAADLHPTGTRLAVRVYTGTFEATLDGGFDALRAPEDLTFERVALGPLSEPQGEAVTYDGLGTGLWTASESDDTPQPLHHYPCQD
ncbi:MAG: hypothetical protein ACE366_27075 [Bradymonadia bacterium]